MHTAMNVIEEASLSDLILAYVSAELPDNWWEIYNDTYGLGKIDADDLLNDEDLLEAARNLMPIAESIFKPEVFEVMTVDYIIKEWWKRI